MWPSFFSSRYLSTTSLHYSVCISNQALICLFCSTCFDYFGHLGAQPVIMLNKRERKGGKLQAGHGHSAKSNHFTGLTTDDNHAVGLTTMEDRVL